MDGKLYKQTVAFILSFLLAMPAGLFAQSAAPQKTQQDIKILLESQNKQNDKNATNIILISAMVGVLGAIGGAYGNCLWQRAKIFHENKIVTGNLISQIEHLNHLLKIEEANKLRLEKALMKKADLYANIVNGPLPKTSEEFAHMQTVAFNKGFDAAERGPKELKDTYIEIGYAKGYGKKATEEFLKGQRTSLSAALKRGRVISAEGEADIIIGALQKRVEELQTHIVSLNNSAKAVREIVALMDDINRSLFSLEKATTPESAKEIRSSILASLESLEGMKKKGFASSVVEPFAEGVRLRLTKNFGILSTIAVAVVATSVALSAYSSPADKVSISQSRLAAARELSDAFSATPELFASRVLLLKQVYGTDLISSVLYEHQEYLPLLEVQLQVSASAAAQQMYAELTQTDTPQQNKDALLGQLR